MRVWIVKPNRPDQWDQNLIRLVEGRRDTTDFVRACVASPHVSSESVENGADSMHIIARVLDLKSDMLANTQTVFEDRSCYVQFCYHQDYMQYFRPTDTMSCYNYFASIISNEVEHVFGTAVFFQVDKTSNGLADLEPRRLFDLLANLHYVKAVQVRGGELVEVAFPNIQGYIRNALKDKKHHTLHNWEFYVSGSCKGDPTDLGIEPVDVADFEGLIVLLRKSRHETTLEMIEQGKLKLDEDQVRGVYADVDIAYAAKFFSSV
jgi:hypothetical protein